MSDDVADLIDAQLSAGEPERDYTDLASGHAQPRCPHCDRHWHGLALTQRIVEMYEYGIYDEAYSCALDDTPVLCPGSTFIGPVPASEVVSLEQMRQQADQSLIFQLHAEFSRAMAGLMLECCEAEGSDEV